jgi:hypothetical protein
MVINLSSDAPFFNDSTSTTGINCSLPVPESQLSGPLEDFIYYKPFGSMAVAEQPAEEGDNYN